jgi:hypothetical protein
MLLKFGGITGFYASGGNQVFVIRTETVGDPGAGRGEDGLGFWT